MSNWILLIPPSETKASPPAEGPCYGDVRRKKRTNAFPELDTHRQLVIDCLFQAIQRGMGLDRLFEVTGASLEEAIRLNRGVLETPCVPARDLYRGVMYEAIDFSSLKQAQKKLFDKNSLIVSGMFGLVRPTDLLPPYKLKFGANLGGAVGKIAQFWRRPVSEILRREIRGRIVWDFLPDQHRRVWDGTGEVIARHQVKFVKRVIRSGVAEYKTISHHSKALKGALIRHLLAKDAKSPRDLWDFVHPDGYRYNRDLSIHAREGDTLVFAAD